MEENELKELKNNVAKLERKGNMNLWLQFFIFPLILAGMGYFFQNTVKQSEKRMEQLKMTQSIVGDLFNDTIYERTAAMKGILIELLENDELSRQIGVLIDKRIDDLLLNGTPDQKYKTAKAVEVFASEGDTLKAKIRSSAKIQAQLTKYEKAMAIEREAFKNLMSGDLEEAEKLFQKVEDVYPSFHQAYEIQRYLKKNRTSFENQEQIKQMQEHIITKMNYGAPKDLISDIKLRSN